ncbi:MAG: electron transfer flavoprotein subunit alpha/FixB family protein [Dehalococcoidia bacterium]|nr:electron transfer flavoprotein subunit alpha/FixB family protein [Dehalococcoidia bacterium]MDW8120222.1 electron transfer flavoprotein subunit alpha/FixB family protein [Chloroflexota bacterium]
MAGVLVFAEVGEGGLAPIAKELLAAGRPLAQALGEPLVAFIAAEKAGPLAQEAGAFGAQQVYVAEHAFLKDAHPDYHLLALEQAVKRITPSAVLLGKTPLGVTVGPRLAFRLGVGVAQDVVSLKVEGGALIAERPVYGGNAMARVALRQKPFVATVRPKAFEPLAPQANPSVAVQSIPVSLDASSVKVKVLERKKVEATGIRLEDARVVVAGGRGLGGPEPFQQLEELARLLGGAVGASRAVCDAGWLPYQYQIGLTGKTITADLYIAVAISGASQHMAGISTVKNIVAINKDGDAPIFQEARFGVVGDWKKVLPAFIDEVRKLLQR